MQPQDIEIKQAVQEVVASTLPMMCCQTGSNVPAMRFI